MRGRNPALVVESNCSVLMIGNNRGDPRHNNCGNEPALQKIVQRQAENIKCYVITKYGIGQIKRRGIGVFENNGPGRGAYNTHKKGQQRDNPDPGVALSERVIRRYGDIAIDNHLKRHGARGLPIAPSSENTDTADQRKDTSKCEKGEGFGAYNGDKYVVKTE